MKSLLKPFLPLLILVVLVGVLIVGVFSLPTFVAMTGRQRNAPISVVNTHPRYDIKLVNLPKAEYVFSQFSDVLEKQGINHVNVVFTDKEQRNKLGWLQEDKTVIFHTSFDTIRNGNTLEIFIYLNREAYDNLGWFSDNLLSRNIEAYFYQALLFLRTEAYTKELIDDQKVFYESMTQRYPIPLFTLRSL